MNIPFSQAQFNPLFVELRFLCCSVLGFLIFGMLTLQQSSADTKIAESAQSLQTLEDFYSAAQTVARKPIVAADESYLSKLEKYQRKSQDAGNLKSVLAAKQAIDDLNAGRTVVASEDTYVASTQKIYIAQHKKAEAEAKIGLAKADRDHLASMKKLVAELTKSGHIDEAVGIQAKIDEFSAIPHRNAGPEKTDVTAQELEIWKKKALEEFPDLKDPNSSLSKVVASLKEEKRSNPGYFSNPKWPYELAREASKLGEESKKAPSAAITRTTEPRLFNLLKVGYDLKGKSDTQGGVAAYAISNPKAGVLELTYDLPDDLRKCQMTLTLRIKTLNDPYGGSKGTIFLTYHGIVLAKQAGVGRNAWVSFEFPANKLSSSALKCLKIHKEGGDWLFFARVNELPVAQLSGTPCDCLGCSSLVLKKLPAP
jgi:hypothetical protein